MFRVAKCSLVAVPLFVFAFALLTTATGCGSKKPPAPPSTDAVDAATDMPDLEAGAAGDAGGSESVSHGEPSAAATLALPTASAQIALKGKKPRAVELKSDGSVMSGGKVVAKITGMKLENPDGKTLLTVGSDGAVTAGEAATAYGSFTGDDLTLAKGDKLGIVDDGTVTMTTGGKAAPLGKFENVASAKRAAVLAVAFVVAPPTADKAAAKPVKKAPVKKP